MLIREGKPMTLAAHLKPTLSVTHTRMFPDGPWVDQLVLRTRLLNRVVVPEPFVEVVKELGVAFGCPTSSRVLSTTLAPALAERIRDGVGAWTQAEAQPKRAAGSGPFVKARDQLVAELNRKMDAAIASLQALLVTSDTTKRGS